MLKKLLRDESGVIISAELALVLTIAVLAMVVGLSEVAVAVNTELNDVSNAIGALDQSYSVTGFRGTAGHYGSGNKLKSYSGGQGGRGYGFTDAEDDCDCNTTCDIVSDAPGNTKTG